MNTRTSLNKITILGNINSAAPVREALKKVLPLIGTEVCDGAITEQSPNILLLMDGDGFDGKWIDTVRTDGDDIRIIHLYSTNNDVLANHNLFFLTLLLPTYRIPLEEFSIAELARVIADIQGGASLKSSSYRPPRTAPLVNFSDIIGVDDLFGANFKDFTGYLSNHKSYIEHALHNIKGNRLIKKQYREKIACYDYLFSTLKVPPHMPITVLVVENEPSGIGQAIESLKDHFSGLRFYLIKDNFVQFARDIRNGNKLIRDYIDRKEGWPFETTLPDNFEFKDIDLILQDIFLGHDTLSGAEIANLYFDVAPQAMVFFLTSMDIETLTASGYEKKVDRLVNKDRIPALMKYYYDRFQELYGQLLWDVFVKAQDRGEKPQLTDRTSVRNLLANIRSWMTEPKVLFHGFALPEMVDHEYRHTSGLWRMTNKILGPLLERIPGMMPAEDRILLALAIWLHDIGHRGDEHHFVPMEIRENHGAISESLILDHFDSLGIGWLKELCDNKQCQQYHCCCGSANRNKIKGCFSKDVCSLRKLGLMCRYHQSTAPMTADKDKLQKLIQKLKFPSPYCIIGKNDFINDIADPCHYQIQQWLDRTKDFEWFGSDIRTLDEFEGGEKQLLKLTGMLRWLDALHTHSDKVGSALEVKSFLSYLEMRKKFCEKRIDEIDDLLSKTVVGSEAYLNALAERDSLDRYSELLELQGIHLWRSGLVRDINGEWFWDDQYNQWAYRIVFELYDIDHFENDDDIKTKISLDSIKEHLEIKGEKDMPKIGKTWSDHVWEEVIESEIEGQVDGDNRAFFETYFQGINMHYCYIIPGKEPISMCEVKAYA